MWTTSLCPLLALAIAICPTMAQEAGQSAQVSLPTFAGSFTAGGRQYTVAGRAPALGGTTTIPTVVVPISLVFGANPDQPRMKRSVDASPDISKIVQSPIFQKFPFATGTTQYGDAVQRAEFYQSIAANTGANAWHTLLGQPRILHPIQIDIPASDGYLLTSKRTGHSLAVVDLQFVQKKLFQQLTRENLAPNELLIALTKNTMFYPLNDATVCCSWGAHGVYLSASPGAASKIAQPFILGTYLDPRVVPHYSDIQTLTEQLVEWFNDPLRGIQENRFPAWRNPNTNSCGGHSEGSSYRFAEPTDSANMPNATRVTMHGTLYTLENAALLPWFAENPNPQTFKRAYSFPDTDALPTPALPCSRLNASLSQPTATPIPENHLSNGHQLIGYWTSYAPGNFSLRDVSPQWDVVIVAFAPPEKGSASQIQFNPPLGETADQFRSDIAYLQAEGKKVLISLGGGGEIVTLNTVSDRTNFVNSVSAIVRRYGFDGVDLDFETPSLMLDPGDTDFRHPTTPSVVNLIAAMQELHRRFGPNFMIAEVPEGPQVPAGMETYGGQFGVFLPVIYGTRHILSFVDVQNYNTPPLSGLDGNYYMPGTSDYYVAMAEMMVRGFPVAGNVGMYFPPLPPEKVAIGFLVGSSDLANVENALRYVIQGKRYPGGEYKLLQTSGYRNFSGAMFWNIESDRRGNYRMSNAIGPLLHTLPRVVSPPATLH